MLFVLLFFVFYLGVGVPIARKTYANQIHISNTGHPGALKAAEREYMSISHSSGCWLGPSYGNSNKKPNGYRCDCGSNKRWSKAKSELDNLRAGVKAANVRSPYITMIGWPVLGFDSYLKGGVVKKPDYNRIAELESTALRELSE